MIFSSNQFKIYIAAKPVDFRKGMDGLAAIIQSEFDLDPFNGALFIFRSKRSDRMKIILWDGTGLILIYKRIEGRGFIWPGIKDGMLTITKSQFEALFEGIDWRRVTSRQTVKPRLAG
jgi:transposase